MTDFLTNIFEAVSPFMLAFGPVLIVVSGIPILYRLFNQSDEDLERGMHYYFDRLYSRRMRRQRRAARRRLMRYRRECRRRAKYDVFSRKENAYFVEFMRKE